MLSSVLKIFIKTKKKIFSHTHGENLSTFVGDGFDFAGLKSYDYEDDYRRIDWLSLAKTNELSTKTFHEEKRLNIVAISLLSGSMCFGTQKPKQQSVVQVVSTLGYSCLKNSDLFNSVIFTNSNQVKMENIGTISTLSEHLKKIDSFPSFGKSIDYDKLNLFMEKSIKQKSLIFIIGDFLDHNVINKFPKKHEIFVVILRDRFEESPKSLGMFNAVDPNNHKIFNNNLSKQSAKDYSKLIKSHDSKLYKILSKYNIKFVKIYTDSQDNHAKALRGLFK